MSDTAPRHGPPASDRNLDRPSHGSHGGLLGHVSSAAGPREWSALAVAVLGIAAVLALALSADSPLSATLSRGAGVLAVAMCLWAVTGMPPVSRGVWWGLWIFQALGVAGDLVYDTLAYYLNIEPFPSVADVLYLSAYVALLGALILLVRRQRPGRDRQTWIDTVIITIAAACIVMTIVIAPMMTDVVTWDPATFIALAYPFLDLLALSVLIRLLVGLDNVNPALALLASSIVMSLIADLVFNGLAAQGITVETPPWLEALFLAGVVLLTVSAFAPGAKSITTPSRTTHRTKGRLFGLALGAMTAPALLALEIWDDVGTVSRMLAIASIAVLLLILWGALILMEKVEQQSALLAELARRDSLTGLANRRSWDFELDRISAWTTAKHIPLTIAVLDLDHFKQFNDRHGHPAGDSMLIDCAQAWQAQLEPPALLARYGGEEFAALLPGTALTAAASILDRVRRNTPGEVTVSIGLAEHHPDETAQQTFDRADRALYRAKSGGRDQVVADQGSETPAAT